MEKISGIIPVSPRLTAVDLKEAAPVRPGTPSFGRPQGVSTLNTAATVQIPQRVSAIQQDMAGWKLKDTQQAAMAAELSDRFFIKNRQPAEEAKPAQAQFDNPTTLALLSQEVRSVPAGFKTDEVGSLRAASSMQPEFESFRATSSLQTSPQPDFESEPDDMAVMQDFEVEEPELQQPAGLFPKGSFIDRTA